MEHTTRLNGYKPRSYGDILAVASLIAMLISVVGWGLKLEGELNAVRDNLARVQMQVGRGVLPRAEERIETMRHDLEELEEDLEGHSH